MTKLVEYLQAPPGPGWYIVDVMRKGKGPPFRPGRSPNDWAALIMDVDPELFAKDHSLRAQSHWLDLGRHKTQEAAWDYAEQLMATRH
jgi:hypothetical protein